MQRRLAAIMAADLVGYTRMMGQDEAGTHSLLKRLREDLIAPLIEAHRGRVVKLMGDGFLVEFSSLVDAVSCALAWQAEFERGADPEIDGIRFRIGINIGDVIFDEGDLYGDGVNVAARLESIAEPGGICLSGDAFRQVRGKIDAQFQDLGERTLKNVDEPVPVYQVLRSIDALHTGRDHRPPAPDPRGSAIAVKDLPDTGPTIAVLPFTNRAGDPEQDYFADGIAEDIITDLSKIPALTVIARNSSFTYRGTSPDIRSVGRELGVRYVLEGSVRKAGRRLRITAQLIEAEQGTHIWADRYDRDLADVFQVQDDVTEKIVNALKIRLTGRGAAASATNAVSPEAYDLVLRGREQYRIYSSQSHARARQLLQEAVQVDPAYAAPHAGLAQVYLHQWFLEGREYLDQAYSHARQAKDLDPNAPLVLDALGNVLLFKKRHTEALAEIDRWIEIEPSAAEAYASKAGILHYCGHNSEVELLIERAQTLNPFYPFYYTLYVGVAALMMGEMDRARLTLERAVARNRESMPSHQYLAACYGLLGHTDLARASLAEVHRISPQYSLAWLRTYLPYQQPEHLQMIISGLLAAGLADEAGDSAPAAPTS